MKQKCVVAIDQGTTGNRVVAFSREGKVIAWAYREFTQYFPAPGRVEHDPLEIFDTVADTLQDVLKQVGEDNVVSLGITNQRETTLLWYRASGEPVGNAIVWQDRRTQQMCRGYRKHSTFIKSRTGLFPDPYFSATKIQWMLENRPDLREQAEKGEILFGTPETWLLWQLTDGAIHCTEPSNASRTLLYNIRTRQFDPQLCELFDIPTSVLPEVKPSDSFFGYTKPELTDVRLPITGMLGDQQASLFGQCGTDKTRIKATYGTGIFVLSNTASAIPETSKLLATVASQTGNRTDYAVEGSIFTAGAAVQWLRDNLGLIRNADETEDLASTVDSNENVYFVPAFQGLGAPYWDGGARGTLLGLSRACRRETIVRAVLESFAYQVRDVVEAMRDETDLEYTELRVDGGASRNNFIMQFQADLLQIPVERTAVSETTALGVAGLSGIAAGFWTMETFTEIRSTEARFTPAMPASEADRLYNDWFKAVERAKSWC